MITAIVLALLASVLVFGAGYYTGIAAQKRRESALRPQRATEPRDGLEGPEPRHRRRTVVRPGHWRGVGE